MTFQVFHDLYEPWTQEAQTWFKPLFHSLTLTVKPVKETLMRAKQLQNAAPSRIDLDQSKHQHYVYLTG